MKKKKTWQNKKNLGKGTDLYFFFCTFAPVELINLQIIKG